MYIIQYTLTLSLAKQFLDFAKPLANYANLIKLHSKHT